MLHAWEETSQVVSQKLSRLLALLPVKLLPSAEKIKIFYFYFLHSHDLNDPAAAPSQLLQLPASLPDFLSFLILVFSPSSLLLSAVHAQLWSWLQAPCGAV